MSTGDYQGYLDRFEDTARRTGKARKRLDEEHFLELYAEYERLLQRVDPGDIQLDEWKRLEELRFVLILKDEEEGEVL
ncbi:hypothetical protein HYR69_03305 [Candidatus Sumerlaeota bacterium]|nr:hypothetical protein [Candidatus Sumerlaeota bacterium]